MVTFVKSSRHLLQVSFPWIIHIHNTKNIFFAEKNPRHALKIYLESQGLMVTSASREIFQMNQPPTIPRVRPLVSPTNYWGKRHGKTTVMNFSNYSKGWIRIFLLQVTGYLKPLPLWLTFKWMTWKVSFCLYWFHEGFFLVWNYWVLSLSSTSKLLPVEAERSELP